jgi:hypothetical protein
MVESYTRSDTTADRLLQLWKRLYWNRDQMFESREKAEDRG